jgi:hypothetical protein
MTQGSKASFGGFAWLKPIHDREVAGGGVVIDVPEDERRKMLEHGLVRETPAGLQLTNKGYRLVSEQD